MLETCSNTKADREIKWKYFCMGIVEKTKDYYGKGIECNGIEVGVMLRSAKGAQKQQGSFEDQMSQETYFQSNDSPRSLFCGLEDDPVGAFAKPITYLKLASDMFFHFLV